MQGRNFILEFEGDECGSGKGGVRIRHDDKLKKCCFSEEDKESICFGWGVSHVKI